MSSGLGLTAQAQHPGPAPGLVRPGRCRRGAVLKEVTQQGLEQVTLEDVE